MPILEKCQSFWEIPKFPEKVPKFFNVDITKILIICSPLSAEITSGTLTFVRNHFVELRVALYPSYKNAIRYFRILEGWDIVMDVGSACISVRRSFRMCTSLKLICTECVTEIAFETKVRFRNSQLYFRNCDARGKSLCELAIASCQYNRSAIRYFQILGR